MVGANFLRFCNSGTQFLTFTFFPPQTITKTGVVYFWIMSTADITISHPGFQTQAQNTVRSLWKDEDFADVPLASVDDKQVKAHKAVLSSCSPFFKNILLKNPHQSPLLYLANLHSSQLKQVQNLSSNIIDTNDKFRSCGSFITASATSPRTSSPSSLKPASCSGFL